MESITTRYLEENYQCKVQNYYFNCYKNINCSGIFGGPGLRTSTQADSPAPEINGAVLPACVRLPIPMPAERGLVF